MVARKQLCLVVVVFVATLPDGQTHRELPGIQHHNLGLYSYNVGILLDHGQKQD